MVELFGEKVRNLRDKHNQTLAELAEVIGVHPSYVAKIEKGQRMPSLGTIVNISRVFSLNPIETRELFTLAGYDEKTFSKIENLYGSTIDNKRKEVFKMEKQNQPQNKEVGIHVQVPNNLTVLYSDSAFVTARPFGITFDFAQVMGPTQQHNIVARIGLSVAHAKKFQKVLSRKIIEAERLQKEDEQKEIKNSTLGN